MCIFREEYFFFGRSSWSEIRIVSLQIEFHNPTSSKTIAIVQSPEAASGVPTNPYWFI